MMLLQSMHGFDRPFPSNGPNDGDPIFRVAKHLVRSLKQIGIEASVHPYGNPPIDPILVDGTRGGTEYGGQVPEMALNTFQTTEIPSHVSGPSSGPAYPGSQTLSQHTVGYMHGEPQLHHIGMYQIIESMENTASTLTPVGQNRLEPPGLLTGVNVASEQAPAGGGSERNTADVLARKEADKYQVKGKRKCIPVKK
jgi:hypothetical protein